MKVVSLKPKTDCNNDEVIATLEALLEIVKADPSIHSFASVTIDTKGEHSHTVCSADHISVYEFVGSLEALKIDLLTEDEEYD